jgi:hypothetical protein
MLSIVSENLCPHNLRAAGRTGGGGRGVFYISKATVYPLPLPHLRLVLHMIWKEKNALHPAEIGELYQSNHTTYTTGGGNPLLRPTLFNRMLN